MKEKYISPECEITRFESEDILVTSGLTQDGFAGYRKDAFTSGVIDEEDPDW